MILTDAQIEEIEKDGQMARHFLNPTRPEHYGYTFNIKKIIKGYADLLDTIRHLKEELKEYKTASRDW